MVERVKNSPQLRIDGRELQHVSLLTETDVDVVIEIQRARRFGSNPVSLQAGLRVHQHLRRLGNLELLEQCAQVTKMWFVSQLGLPSLNSLDQLRDAIVRLGFAVPDRFLLVLLCRDWLRKCSQKKRNQAPATSHRAIHVNSRINPLATTVHCQRTAD